jgi:hypothetical protein
MEHCRILKLRETFKFARAYVSLEEFDSQMPNTLSKTVSDLSSRILAHAAHHMDKQLILVPRGASMLPPITRKKSISGGIEANERKKRGIRGQGWACWGRKENVVVGCLEANRAATQR